MDLHIKALSNKDAEQIISMVLNIQQKEFNISISLDDQPDLLDIEYHYIANGGGFWGMFADGELVGSIALIKFNNDAGAIRKMFVKREFRGKEFSIAQRLLEELIAYCMQQQIHQVYLGTVSVLKAAQRFYERNNFEKIPKEMLPESFPLMTADDVFYGLKIN